MHKRDQINFEEAIKMVEAKSGQSLCKITAREVIGLALQFRTETDDFDRNIILRAIRAAKVHEDDFKIWQSVLSSFFRRRPNSNRRMSMVKKTRSGKEIKFRFDSGMMSDAIAADFRNRRILRNDY